MKEILILTAGLVGSILTLIVQAIINACTNRVNHKRTIKTLVFQNKLEIVEKAMSWYQEAIDTYYMLQMALKTFGNESIELSMIRVQTSTAKLLKLFEESSSRLNPIYLYYDFSDIENKYNTKECNLQINRLCSEIADINYKVYNENSTNSTVQPNEATKEQMIKNFNKLADLFDKQIAMITEIQGILRREFYEYFN